MKLTKTDECSIEHWIHGIRDEMLRYVLLNLVDAIREVVPYEPETAKGSLFPLARIAKSVERDIYRRITPDDLVLIFDLWCKISAEELLIEEDELEDLFIDFVPIFESTKVPHDEGKWEKAVMLAKNEGIPPGFSTLPKSNEDLRVLAKLCFHLQQYAKHDINSGNLFPLSVRKANELLPHLSIQTINNKMRYLQAFGIIEEVLKGSLKDRKASYYEYIGKDGE